MGSIGGRTAWAVVGAALLLCALPSAVRAEESLRARVDEHEERIEAHRRDDATDALQADLKAAVALFHEAKDAADGEKLRDRLIKEVGSLSRVRDEAVRIAAIEALGKMGHEDCATYLKRYLKPFTDAKRQRVARAAIPAAGEVADDSLVRPLLKIVDRSKNYDLAAQAMQALGRFGKCKRYRKLILEELVDTLKSDMPGAPKPGRDTGDTYLPPKNGHAGTSRWAVLSRALPGALNELTGRDVAGVGDWMSLVNEYEHDLDVLFVHDEEEDA